MDAPAREGSGLPGRPQLVLASASPRRAELLRLHGVRFAVEPADVDERRRPGEAPAAYAARVANDKALAIVAPGRVVLAADTIVVLDGEVLGKPTDAADATAVLSRLSGRTHEVITAVVAASSGRAASDVDRTRVAFATLTDREIARYVATGEPLDKAGAYGIQGAGGALVAAVEGNVQTVIGLSLRSADRALQALGHELLDWVG